MVNMCCMPKCNGQQFKQLAVNDDIVPDSAFIFGCRYNIFGMCIAFGTWALEFVVLVYFYQISQDSHPHTVYVDLVPECKRASESGDRRLGFRRVEEETFPAPTCADGESPGMQAIVCSFIILVLSIAPDFIGGFHLAIRRRDTMQTIMGFAMMSLAVLALVSASAFVIATARSDVDLYTNCIAILFVLACDEQMFHVIKMLFPKFVKETIEEITEEADSTAIGVVNDVRFAELMARKQVKSETEMTKEPQQVESPHASGAPAVLEIR